MLLKQYEQSFWQYDDEVMDSQSSEQNTLIYLSEEGIYIIEENYYTAHCIGNANFG